MYCIQDYCIVTLDSNLRFPLIILYALAVFMDMDMLLSLILILQIQVMVIAPYHKLNPGRWKYYKIKRTS